MAGLHDSILETINYSSAAKFILAFLDKSCFYTVEALAENIAEALISEFNPQSVCIKIEKTQVLTSAKSVGVEIQRP
jgi:dihydroneopterin aldolase